MSEISRRLEILGNEKNKVRAILTWLLHISMHGITETQGENTKNTLIKTIEKEIGLEMTVDEIKEYMEMVQI